MTQKLKVTHEKCGGRRARELYNLKDNKITIPAANLPEMLKEVIKDQLLDMVESVEVIIKLKK